MVLAVHYVTGAFSERGPLLAVPVFMTALAAVTLASTAVEKSGRGVRKGLLVLQAMLLACCLGLAVKFGPFTNVDGLLAVLVGMLAVAAMATQSALVRVALRGSPSTSVMTTNITQLTVDLATLVCGLGKADDAAKARHRVGVTGLCVVGFAVGCTAGAILEVHAGLWALALPAVLAVLAVPLDWRRTNKPTANLI